MKFATFVTVLAAASLLACGKAEEAPAPVAPQPEGEAPLAAAAPAESASAPQAGATPSAQPAAATATAKPAEPRPAPTVQSAGEAGPNAARPDLDHGQHIYRQACAFCHDKGIAGAPKAGDAAAWSARLAQGMDSLYASALGGKGAMPAKGGNPSLADADVKAAVDYLAAQSR